MPESQTRYLFWDGVSNVVDGKLDASLTCDFALLEKPQMPPEAQADKPARLSLTVDGSSEAPAVVRTKAPSRLRIYEVDQTFRPGVDLLSVKLRLRPLKDDTCLLVRFYSSDKVLLHHEVYTAAQIKRMPMKDPRSNSEPRENAGRGKVVKTVGPGTYTVRAWIAHRKGFFDGHLKKSDEEISAMQGACSYKALRPTATDEERQKEIERVEKKYADRLGMNQTAVPTDVEVIVTGPDGPVDGVKVRVSNSSQKRLKSTAGGGTVAFAGVKDGQCTVEVDFSEEQARSFFGSVEKTTVQRGKTTKVALKLTRWIKKTSGSDTLQLDPELSDEQQARFTAGMTLAQVEAVFAELRTGLAYELGACIVGGKAVRITRGKGKDSASPAQVDVTKLLAGARDAILTHTHPKGVVLSADDCGQAVKVDLAEIRAVGFSTSSLKRPLGGWPKPSGAMSDPALDTRGIYDSPTSDLTRKAWRDRDWRGVKAWADVAGGELGVVSFSTNEKTEPFAAERAMEQWHNCRNVAKVLGARFDDGGGNSAKAYARLVLQNVYGFSGSAAASAVP